MTLRSLAIGLQSIRMHPTGADATGMKDYDTTFKSMTLTSLAVHSNGVEAFLYCQLEGALGDETVTLARQQSTDIFCLVR